MYGKLFASLYQGTLRGNADLILVFSNLIAHMDSAGWVDKHPKAISDECGISLDRVRAALTALEAPDPESRTEDEEGRRLIRIDGHRDWGWRIVNGPKYQAIRNLDERKEQNRLAQARWRDKHKNSKQESAGVITNNQDKPPSAHVYEDANKDKDKHTVKTKTARQRAPAVPADCPDDVCSDVWRDWLALRKAKKAPVTPTVTEGARSEAAKAGMTLEAFLRVWCRRGTQGLEADWLKPQERNGHNSEPDWRREQREQTEAFAGSAAVKRPNHRPLTEIFDVAAKTLG